MRFCPAVKKTNKQNAGILSSHQDGSEQLQIPCILSSVLLRNKLPGETGTMYYLSQFPAISPHIYVIFVRFYQFSFNIFKGTVA
jgi:hypothetical protein